jgi:hypothetical protein
MSQAIAVAAQIGFVVIWFVGVLAWFTAIVCGFKAVRRTRPGVNVRGRETLWNPANVLLRTSLLTEEGLRYRRKCFVAVVVFIACIGVPLLIAGITGQLR